MNYRTVMLAFTAAAIAAVGGYGLYRVGLDHGMKLAASTDPFGPGPNQGPQKPGDVDPQTGKKVLFIGAGAIGSFIGSFLTRAGHDVTLVDPWAENVDTINAKLTCGTYTCPISCDEVCSMLRRGAYPS